jgi:hypothetical protein
METKKRVIYMVSSLPEWIDVAKKLKKNNGWEPVYWLTSSQTEKRVKEEFPNVIYHHVYDALRGVYPDKFLDVKFPLDKEIIYAFLKHEKVVLKMMDRQDPYQSITYHERKRLYYNQLIYWLFTLKKLSIDVLITEVSPHFLSNYICYAVCKYLKIQTVMFEDTKISGLIFLRMSIGDVPTIRIVPEDVNHASNSKKKSELIKSYIRNVSGEYRDAIPWYLKKEKERDKLERNKFKKLIKLFYINKWPSYLNKIFSLRKVNRNNYFKRSKYLIEDSPMTNFELRRLNSKSKKKIEQLKKIYESMCQTVSLDKKYLYFPLHYQPEQTSSPEGDIYVDQWLVINMISCLLPKGWKLYIKEHPSQFMFCLSGYMGRTIDFYKDINKFKNVKMVDDKINPFKLIDNAKAVVTLTGTSGLEAILRGTPALVFGYAWYRNYPGVFYTTTTSECADALKKIDDGFKVNSKEVESHLLDLEKKCVRVCLPSSRIGSIQITYGERVNELYRGIISIIK